MVRGSSCSQLLGGCPAIQSDVVAYLNNNAQGINTNEIKVHTHCIVGENSFSFCLRSRTQVYVEVQYSFSFLSLWLPLLAYDQLLAGVRFTIGKNCKASATPVDRRLSSGLTAPTYNAPSDLGQQGLFRRENQLNNLGVSAVLPEPILNRREAELFW